VDLIKKSLRPPCLIQSVSCKVVPPRLGQVLVYGVFNKSEKSISLNLRSSDKSNFVSVQAGSFLYGTPFRGAIRPFEGFSYVELVIEIVSNRSS